MTKIKTLTFLNKCLKIDVPIYKEVDNVTFKVSRVILYRTALIEIISYLNNGTLFTLLSKEHIDSIVKALNDADKARTEFAATKSNLTAQEESTGEPEYEQLDAAADMDLPVAAV